ncbi:YPO3983 family protein [Erwinia sp. MYb416]|uniref:YPO3983 family protein n=1 Tax=Erwinia sp. MYb416 TaxID=3108532 RepID=UPI00309AF4F5
MSALSFPCTIFTTKKRMDDFGANDMCCGDLSAEQLKRDFGLATVSDRVDPWTLARKKHQQVPTTYPAASSAWKAESISKQECINILFDEFRECAKLFSFYGPYRDNIIEMITHMQHKKGLDFSSSRLDAALRQQILTDISTTSSSRILLQKAISINIDWESGFLPLNLKEKLTDAINESILPKFDRIEDRFNGMGISVHDTWATQISIKSLRVEGNRFRAVIHYKIQDHFGLDNQDVLDWKFRQFRLFRIWFVLQRYSKFAFKPFMTNMETTIEITGERNVKKT